MRRSHLLCLLLGLAMSAPLQAAEPPACQPATLKADAVIAATTGWAGFAPVKAWRRTAERLDPCTYGGPSARVFLTVQHPSGEARLPLDFAADLNVSVDKASGLPVDSPAHREQFSRLVAQRKKLARAMAGDEVVRAWSAAHRGVVARIDDMGGHGEPCAEAFTPGAEAEAALRFCVSDGLEALRIADPAELGASGPQFDAAVRKSCEWAAGDVIRYVDGDGAGVQVEVNAGAARGVRVWRATGVLVAVRGAAAGCRVAIDADRPRAGRPWVVAAGKAAASPAPAGR